jgi:hypothetical protein
MSTQATTVFHFNPAMMVEACCHNIRSKYVSPNQYMKPTMVLFFIHEVNIQGSGSCGIWPSLVVKHPIAMFDHTQLSLVFDPTVM